MKNNKEKRTRIRNPLKKEEKLQKIIETGKELFIRDGDHMSMRELAREMDLVVSGLYRYIQNKRELWFACNNQEFEKFSEDFDKIEEKSRGNDIILLRKFGEYFLNLAKNNYPLFKFMFLSTPPLSTKDRGPFELQCKRAGFTNLNKIITRIVKTGHIKEKNAMLLSLAIWGFVLGPSIISSPMFSYFFDGFPDENFNPDEYRDYVLDLIGKMLIN